jgi:two-component system, response regulator PdtaR
LNADIILQNENAIFIKQNYRFIKLKTDELVYIEADRNHSFLVTTQHRYLVRLSLANLVERLSIPHLVRIHRSFAVNVTFVEEFDDNEIVVHANKRIPFSSMYREDFLQCFSIK